MAQKRNLQINPALNNFSLRKSKFVHLRKKNKTIKLFITSPHGAFGAALALTIVSAALATPNAERDVFSGETRVHTARPRCLYVRQYFSWPGGFV